MHKHSSRAALGKAIAAAAIAKLSGKSPDEIIEQRYWGDRAVRLGLDAISRAATEFTTTTDAEEMIPHLVAAYEEVLQQASAFGALRAISVSLGLEEAGIVTVPTRAKTRSDPGAVAWVGEGGVLPVSNSTIGAAKLRPLKAGGVVPLTRELLDYSDGLAEQTLLAILGEDVGQLLDRTLTDDSPAIEAVRPPGLLYNVTPSVSVDFYTDLPLLIAAAADGAWRVPALIVSPARLTQLYGHTDYAPQLQAGKLGPFALLATPFMNDPHTIIALDAAAFTSVLAEPEVYAAENASLVMANADGTPPTQAIKTDGTIDVPGQVNPGAGIMVSGGPVGAGTANAIAASMLQQYSVALRHITRVDWALGRPDAVAAVSGANW